MSKNPIDIARQRIAHHESEIARLTAFLEAAEALVRESEQTVSPEFLASTSTVFSPNVIATPGVVNMTVMRNEPVSTPTREVLVVSEEILRQKSEPMAAADIYDRLIKRGIKIAGQNPKGNLTAKFATRKDIFSHNKDTGLWSLTAWDEAKTSKAPSEQSEGASKPEGSRPLTADDLL